MAIGIKDRFLGTVVGLACGDALGAGVEFRTAAEVAASFPNGLADYTGGGAFDWRPGEPTDDTQLAMLWLESLGEHGKVVLPDIGRRYVEWLDDGPRDVGNLTRAAILALKSGVPPTDSGRVAWEQNARWSAGNGSVMACAPIGLLHAGELRGIADDAAAACRLTHFDPRCVAACRAVSLAVALAVRGQDEDVLERASLVASPAPLVRQAIEQAPGHDPRLLQVDGPDMGLCVRTVEIAFAAYEWAPSFEAGLRAVVERGGDADTNGAVAGALLGARFGLSGIPQRWIEGLEVRVALLDASERLWLRVFPGSRAVDAIPAAEPTRRIEPA